MKIFILSIFAYLHWDTYTCILALEVTCILAFGRFHSYTGILSLGYFCAIVSIEMEVFKCKYRSVSVQVIFRKNPSQCFWEKSIA